MELYPTLEVGPVMPRTEAFLAHNAIPVQFTPEDFDQVLTGNFVTKVIYLPDPEFQELALAGVETLVSTRLDPGVDPIVEADRRGAILAIVRLGNKDLQVPGGQAQEGGVAAASYQIARRLSANAAAAPMPMGMPVGGAFDHADGLHRRRDRAAVRHADVRHADRPARPAHVPLGVPAGLQKHVDREPHARASAEADREGEGRREAGAGLQLSEAGRPRPHRRTHQSGRRLVSSSRWATAASGSMPGRCRRAVSEPERCPVEQHWTRTCRNDGCGLHSVRQPSTSLYTSTTRDNGPIDPLSGNRSAVLRAASCRQDGNASALVAGRGGDAAGPAAERALLASRRHATGSDWQPATPAGRTIARVLSAGRDQGPAGGLDFAGGRPTSSTQPQPGPRKAGFLIGAVYRLRVTNIRLAEGAGSLSHHRGHRPPLRAVRTRTPLRHPRRHRPRKT